MRNKAQASKVHVYTPRSKRMQPQTFILMHDKAELPNKRMQPQTFILMHDKAELPNNDARDKQSKCVIKRKRVKYSGSPFSTATNGPWKFGRIDGVAVLTGLG